MSNYVICLIEDEQKHAKETLDKLKVAAAKYGGSNCDFSFEFLKGSVEKQRDKKEYIFYEPEILNRIEQKISEEKGKGNRIGLLLDVLLTEEDIDNAMSSYYASASIAKDIYSRFSDDIPIYIITATSAFGSQSDIIMGADLSEQYISYRNLIKYSYKEDIVKLFSFYKKYYDIEEKGTDLKKRVEGGV